MSEQQSRAKERVRKVRVACCLGKRRRHLLPNIMSRAHQATLVKRDVSSDKEADLMHGCQDFATKIECSTPSYMFVREDEIGCIYEAARMST